VKGPALVKTGGVAGWEVIQKTRESLVSAWKGKSRERRKCKNIAAYSFLYGS
jgi:hypothetical protein